MKRVVSVSLGASKRDHRVKVNLAGETFEIYRRGTDGNKDEALRIIKELDGLVDAVGLGGIDVYVYAGSKRYALSDGLKLMHAAKISPVVDGSGLKNTLERKAVRYLMEKTSFVRPGTRVLMVSAVDRFGMAQAFAEAGCDMTFGDVAFALGIPYRIKSLKKLEILARTLLPVISHLPFQMIYPTGNKQGKEQGPGAEKFSSFYDETDIIAGDFHYIRKYLPPRLDNKVVVTNTTTESDKELLKERGASALITTTPVLEGRSFGTNVMEGVLVALAGKPWQEISVDEYNDLLDKVGFKPQIMHLQKEAINGTA